MRHYVVFSHPRRKSFNGGVLDQYVRELKRVGERVLIRDLYRSEFNPVLTAEEYDKQWQKKYAADVTEEQQRILQADAVTFIFPIWWAGFPAILKGYIDRVFAYHFAYELRGEQPIPKLKGKKAAIIATCGTPEEDYVKSGMFRSMNQVFVDGIFHFCGLEPLGNLYLGNAVLSDQQRREEMFCRVKVFARSVAVRARK